MPNFNQDSNETEGQMKHTPGPWKMTDRKAAMGNNCGINIESQDLIVCRLPDGASTDGGYSFPHQLSNAKLIAAAPDLLEACQKAKMAHWENRRTFTDKDHKLMNTLCDAIKKAT
jgi:hypothetical protein